MRFGLFGGPSRRAGASSDAQAYESYVQNVCTAEKLGFSGAYLVEHHFTGAGQVSSSLALLTYLAALTSTIRLGTAVVVVPWHNPVLLAEQAATLDLLSGGRLDLGLGRGYRDLEFRGFGVPREQAVSRFQDTLRFLRMAWSTQERFDFDGEHWQLRDVVVEPRPVQQPHPPLWMGAASPESLQFAAVNGLKLFLDQVATFDEVRARVDIYRQAQADAGIAGTPADIALTRPLLLAEHASEREVLLQSHLQTLGFLAGTTGRPEHNPFYSDPADRRERAEQGAIIGDAAECIERLSHLADLGIHQVLFTRTGHDVLHRFARSVMPTLS